MMSQIHDFSSACAKFNQDVDTIRNDEGVFQKLTTVRLVMDKVMNMERAFILTASLTSCITLIIRASNIPTLLSPFALCTSAVVLGAFL